ncbi:MAG: Polymer-forming cytoskeletal [Syntrophorhabdus sp. PtaB.Bin047]|jgi:cytoskeletal protein CcmA (bactofilin family)|nr:MAG: Polymer-forming cytoskeletal [Syntrophorhabdus sp. PtaB.Bin047]
MAYVASNASSKDEKAGTVFAGDLEVQGTVKFKSSLMIEGVFSGEIISEGVLTVGPSAKVTATIRTKTLVSRGEINGDVYADEQVVLEETAVHNGNITSPGIVIERGSTFNGSCSMKRANAGNTGSF